MMCGCCAICIAWRAGVDMFELNMFCDPADVRPICNKPFNVAGRSIATNGHILVAIPRADEYGDDDEFLSNKVIPFLEKLDAVTEWLPMPEITALGHAGDADGRQVFFKGDGFEGVLAGMRE
jgi:hypothetical protein